MKNSNKAVLLVALSVIFLISGHRAGRSQEVGQIMLMVVENQATEPIPGGFRTRLFSVDGAEVGEARYENVSFVLDETGKKMSGAADVTLEVTIGTGQSSSVTARHCQFFGDSIQGFIESISGNVPFSFHMRTHDPIDPRDIIGPQFQGTTNLIYQGGAVEFQGNRVMLPRNSEWIMSM